MPKITVAPSSQRVKVTHNVMLIATASGIGVENFTYQWQRGNHIIKGETKPILLIYNVLRKSSRYHTYSCIVRNKDGNSAMSNSAKLFVSSKQLFIISDTIVKYLYTIATYTIIR